MKGKDADMSKRKCVGKIKVLAVWLAVVAAFVLYGCGDGNAQDAPDRAEEALTEEKDSQKADGDSRTDGTQGESVPDVFAYRESLMEYDKEETVYALAGTDGTPYEITVRTTLKCPGRSETIADYTLLTDIKNKEGDEAFTLKPDGSLIWENHGTDIRYEGIADKELPVSVKITYYLDGREVQAEELSGADGRIKIRFDYENRTGSGKEMVPFMAVSGMALPGDKVSSITLSDGKVRSMDDDVLLIQTLFPGMDTYFEKDAADGKEEDGAKEDTDFPQFWEVSFDAVDFSLDFTATIITNGMLAEMDLAELFDKADSASEGYGRLGEGTDELEEGLKELSGQSAELVNGAASLQSGLESLHAAIAMLPQDDPAVAQLQAAAGTLAGGSAQLTEGVKSYTAGVDRIYEGVSKLSDGASEMTDSGNEMTSMTDKIKALQVADRTYDNYGGIEAGKTGSVMFIIETDGIE